MAIPQSTILRYDSTTIKKSSTELIKEAKANAYQTAFLCHSHKDAHLAKGLQGLLQANGWKVYIDWDDTSMPDTPNRETAAKIRLKIKEHAWFLFLATQNSMTSRWCPWEIGYADGVKPIDSILIIPTSNTQGTHGNEYLGLYRKIDLDPSGSGYAAYKPDGTGIWIRNL